jgi:hypothetical protein
LSLKIPEKLKLNRFPADCVIISYNDSQHIAKFRAGAICGSPAKTGSDNNNKTAVISTAQPNKANFVHKKNKGLSHKTLLRLVYYGDQH